MWACAGRDHTRWPTRQPHLRTAASAVIGPVARDPRPGRAPNDRRRWTVPVAASRCRAGRVVWPVMGVAGPAGPCVGFRRGSACGWPGGAGGDWGAWAVAEQPGLGFAGLLRQLRAEAGLTQEELAEAAGLSPRSVSDLERGIHGTARQDTARLLADALGLT